MNKLMSERDKQAELLEGQTFYTRDPKFPNNEIQRFLTDGLDKSYVSILEQTIMWQLYHSFMTDKEYEQTSEVTHEQ